MGRRKQSFLTVTDLFCGAGGSSLGALNAGLEIRIASNHWQLAVETHASNFRDTDHDCADVSQVHPKRYPTTDVLIASPECTTHSPAGGSRRLSPQRHLFDPHTEDPAAVRSRATAFDVVRFAEFHRYRIIIVENVYEFVRWELFHDWLAMFTRMGYDHQVVCLNSMFAHPTPQSRDRVYVVFWKKGNRAPNLDLRPKAYCPRCDKVIRARQAWKTGRTVGKYRQQYVYVCGKCRLEVRPYYYAALNAIDFSIPAERIGDRTRPLKDRTRERIRFGLEKYGHRALVVNVKQGARDSSRAWPADVRELGTVPSWDDYFALAHPAAFFVAGQGEGERVYGPEKPLRAQVASSSHDALVVAPMVVETAYTSKERRARTADEPLPAQSGQQSLGVVTPYLVKLRGTHPSQRGDWSSGASDPIGTVSAGGVHHGVVQGAALINLRDTLMPYPLDQALHSQTAKGPVDAIIARSPFIVTNREHNTPKGVDEALSPMCTGQHHMLVQYYSHGASAMDDPVPTVTVRDRHALVSIDEQLDVDDCYFRMLQPHEIGRAMAFPDDYIVLGTKRDRVKQFGNAVTPPAMDFLIRRCVESLHPERAA